MTGYMDAEAYNGLSPPGPVRSLTISSIETEITLNWLAPNTGGTYSGVRVYYNDTGTPPDPATDTPDDTVPAGTLTFTLDGLTASVLRYFYLYAENEAGYSTVATEDIYTLPPPVSDFQRSPAPVGTTSICVVWSPPPKGIGAGTYDGFNIFVNQSPTPPANPASGGVSLGENDTTYTASGLTALGTYYAYIYTTFTTSGLLSVGEQTGTMTLTAIPGTPVGANSGNVEATSFEVNWSAPASGAVVTQYYVSWSTGATPVPNPLSYEDTQIADNTTFTVQIGSLSPQVLYYYWIWAANPSGISATPASGSQTTAPLPPDPPTALTISGITSGGATAEWTVGALADYTLVWIYDNNTSPAPVPGTTTPDFTVTAPSATQTFSGLTPNQFYRVFVASKRTAGGIDLYSGYEETSFTTDPL
jgi:hypothetical protein